jgi:NAD(P)-dependent dehydrogenase (short-subunit alcohol dehydrogenase family)
MTEPPCWQGNTPYLTANTRASRPPLGFARFDAHFGLGDDVCMDILKGKTAIVTGAASGIGRASAILFAAEGAAVVALDRAPEVEATVATIRAAGGRGLALVKDASAESDVAGAVVTALEEYGRLDVCYANAGISGGLVPFFEELDRHFPARQICGARNGEAEIRLDHLHRVRRRFAFRRRRHSL